MKLFLLALLVAAVSAERLASPLFNDFMATHGREYATEAEHNFRYWAYHRNMAKWELLNEWVTTHITQLLTLGKLSCS